RHRGGRVGGGHSGRYAGRVRGGGGGSGARALLLAGGRDRGPGRPARLAPGERAGHGGRARGVDGQRRAERAEHGHGSGPGRGAGAPGVSGSSLSASAARPDRALRSYVELARPFTLLPPALGVVSGAFTAWGAGGTKAPLTLALVLPIVWGALMAATLNAASNAINQIYDLEIDRVNKPRRPLCTGALSMGQAWGFTLLAFVMAWGLAWLADPTSRHACFWLVLFTSVLVWAYSAPPLRTKRHGIWANVTIAIPRGMLLKVAGWSTVKTVM